MSATIIHLPTAASEPVESGSYKTTPPSVVVPKYRLEVRRKIRAQQLKGLSARSEQDGNVEAAKMSRPGVVAAPAAGGEQADRIARLQVEADRLSREIIDLQFELMRAGIGTPPKGR